MMKREKGMRMAAKPAGIEAFEWQLNLREPKLLNDS